MSKTMSPMERVVSALYAQFVTTTDQALLDMVFSQEPTQQALQQALDDCLRVCDIEAMGAHKSLMLSYLMRDHPELTFSAYAGPRIKGLIDFFRFANIKTLAHFSKIGKALNAAGIPVLIFKGAAMKALRPELSRPMSDVDILIPPDRFAEAVSIGKSLGYQDALGGSKHAVDLYTADNKSALDVHHTIFDSVKDNSAFNRNLFARARNISAFGVNVLLPAHEDLFFIVLVNLVTNLRKKSSVQGLFYALFDCKFLLSDKKDFDWSLVRDNIKCTKTQNEVKLALEFMNTLVPGIIPAVESNLPMTRATQAYFEQVIFDENYLIKLRHQCKTILVIQLLRYPRHYGKTMLKWFIFDKLRHSPAFVRWYLKRQEKRVLLKQKELAVARG